MKPAILKRVATAAFLLSLCGASATAAKASTADDGTPAVSAAANRCITLGVQHRGWQGASADGVPTLSNQCDFAVTIAYCIDNPRAGARACNVAGQHAPDMKILPPHAALRVDMHAASTEGDEINWIACRATPGMISRFIAGGGSGQCVSPDAALQAHAQLAPVSP